MKKYLLLLVMMVSLWGCRTSELPEDISDDHFDNKKIEAGFDADAYLDALEGILISSNYENRDLEAQGHKISQDPLMTTAVVENMISLYNTFEVDHDTYTILNFFDHHILFMGSLDREILLNKSIVAVEERIGDYQNLIEDVRFEVLGADYISRVTDVFLDNINVSNEILLEYPDMLIYIENLKKAIKGGYQIRRIDNEYYILTDYASAFVRYRDYVSEESVRVIDILASESRNPVFIEGYYQRENETAAYKANEIESFLKDYPDSMYYDMLRSYYIQYLRAIVSNPRNIETIGGNQEHYKDSVVSDFNKIIDRYSNSNLARILTELLVWLEDESFNYDPIVIETIYEMIETTY